MRGSSRASGVHNNVVLAGEFVARYNAIRCIHASCRRPKAILISSKQAQITETIDASTSQASFAAEETPLAVI